MLHLHTFHVPSRFTKVEHGRDAFACRKAFGAVTSCRREEDEGGKGGRVFVLSSGGGEGECGGREECTNGMALH